MSQPLPAGVSGTISLAKLVSEPHVRIWSKIELHNIRSGYCYLFICVHAMRPMYVRR